MGGTQAASLHLVAHGEVKNGWSVVSSLMVVLLWLLGCESETASAPVESVPPPTSEAPQGVPSEELRGGLPEPFRREVALAVLEDRDPAPDVGMMAMLHLTAADGVASHAH